MSNRGSKLTKTEPARKSRASKKNTSSENISDDNSYEEVNLDNYSSSNDSDEKQEFINTKSKSKISKTYNNVSKNKPKLIKPNEDDSSDAENIEKEKIYKTSPAKVRSKKNQTEQNESDSDNVEKSGPKRGRPKKNLTESNNENELQEKPKRGRPKKVQPQQNEDQNDSNEEAKKPAPKRGRPNKNQQNNEEEDEIVKPAPKRGRPKKNQQNNNEEEDEAKNENQKPAPKRGRPKKNQQNNNEEEEEIEKPAPKRGRPRKNPPNNDNDKNQQAPKRGRAKKNQDQQDNDNDDNENDDENEQKKSTPKRGRPKKNPAENNNDNEINEANDESQQKPKRGRPKKVQPTDNDNDNDNDDNDDDDGDDNNDQSKPKPTSTKIADSDLAFDTRNAGGRKACAQQTMGIITYGANMGHYTVALSNSNIESVDIRKQISNAFKYSKTYDEFYTANIGIENIYRDVFDKSPFDSPKVLLLDDDLNPIEDNEAFSDRSLRNGENLHKNLTYYTKFDACTKQICEFEVVNDFAINKAKSLINEDQLNPCVFNFTSLSKPPNNFLRGTDSQEDSMMRRSSLYVTLMNSPMYELNIKLKDGIYSDSMVYSSRVPVFRSPVKEKLVPKNEVFEVSFISCLLPDLKTPKAERVGGRVYINPAETSVVFVNRLRKMILLAIEKKHNAIVVPLDGRDLMNDKENNWLNSFTCLLFDEGLGKFFEKIVFACHGKGSTQFKEFQNQF